MKSLIVLMVLLYNLSLVVGTAYLINVYNWSPWTFLLTIFLIAGIRDKNE